MSDAARLAGRRVVVTGGTGFIGRRLTAQLAATGAHVEAWGRRPSGAAERAVDLGALDQVTGAFEAVQPEVVFHLAAVGVQHDRAHDPHVIGENVDALAHVLAALRANRGAQGPRPRLIVAGTMAEYGAATSPIAESAACQPTTAYAMAKLACTQLAGRYADAHGVDAIVARLFHVYGPGEGAQRLLPTLARQLGAGRSVALSDGRQARDFVHVDDACEALIRLAVAPDGVGQIVNIGTGRALSIRSVAETIADVLGADRALLQFGSRGRSPGDEDLLQADVRRLAALVGWVPPQRFLTAPTADALLG